MDDNIDTYNKVKCGIWVCVYITIIAYKNAYTWDQLCVDQSDRGINRDHQDQTE